MKFKTSSPLIWWFLACVSIIGFVQKVQAQQNNEPHEKSTLEELRFSSSEIMPLPPGQWSVVWKNEYDFCQPGSSCQGTSGRVFVLENKDPNADVYAIVVRHTSQAVKWNSMKCYQESYNPWFNNFKTSVSSLNNKCVRGWLGGTTRVSNDWYWQRVKEGLGLVSEPIGSKKIRFSIQVQQWNNKRYEIDVFVDYKNPDPGLIYHKWIASYTEAIFSGLYDGVTLPDSSILDIKSLNKQATDDMDRYAAQALQPLPLIPYLTPEGAVSRPDLTPTQEPANSSLTKQKENVETHREGTLTSELHYSSQSTDTQKEQSPSDIERFAVMALQPYKPPQSSEVETQASKLQPDKALESLASIRPVPASRKPDDDEKTRVKKLEQDLQRMREMLTALTAQKNAQEEKAQAAPNKVVFAKRYGLVVGNAAYKNVSKLENSKTDAQSFSEALEKLGFNVSLHLDLSQRNFNKAVRDFKEQLSGGEEVVFYYAGHGVQLGNTNYLLPIDVGSGSADQVKDEAVDLQRVLDSFSDKNSKFALAVVDACRDNPFKGDGRAIATRGLAPTSAATGQMIMFSAGAGQQALDKLSSSDKEKNGLFTRIFLKEMVKPGVPVDKVLRNVRQEVVKLAKSVGHEQVPALYDQTIGEFYFKP